MNHFQDEIHSQRIRFTIWCIVSIVVGLAVIFGPIGTVTPTIHAALARDSINTENTDGDNTDARVAQPRVANATSDVYVTGWYSVFGTERLVAFENVESGTPTVSHRGALTVVYGDIGFHPNGTLYGVDVHAVGGIVPVYTINPLNGAETFVGNIPSLPNQVNNAVTANALSFDPLGNAYTGSGSATGGNYSPYYWRFNAANPATGATIWADLSTLQPQLPAGTTYLNSSGDILFASPAIAYLAISHTVNGTTNTEYLVRVMLDSNYNPVSMTVLGALPDQSYGLALDTDGDIYVAGAITPGVSGNSGLYRLDISGISAGGGTAPISTTLLPGTSFSMGYNGATGSMESVFATTVDTDGDGEPDSTDLDDDNDGIPDTSEPTGDTDNDGIADTVDLDSDNDGIPDVTEAGGSDPDGDGIIGTGDITDNDGDGLHDPVDNVSSSVTSGTPLPLPNTDASGAANWLDIDADDDGIPDNVEAQTTAGYFPPSGNDIDGDGLDDTYDPLDGYDPGNPAGTSGWSNGTPIPPVNTDSDSNPDYIDTDSDNDSINDIAENGDPDNTLSGIDTDGDGLDNNFDTVNTTGTTPDVNDAINDPTPSNLGDEDGDVAADGNNAVPLVSDVDYRDVADTTDTDGDGIRDSTDLDDDNDGIPDTDEPAGDTDGDGIPDTLDLDSDNDGIPDVTEAGGSDPDGDGIIGTGDITDGDGDGLDDSVGGSAPIGCADTVLTQAGTPGAANALGTPDGVYARVDATNDTLSLEFPTPLPSATTIAIRVQTSAVGNVLRYEQSNNGTTWTNQQQASLNLANSPFDITYTPILANHQYIRLTFVTDMTHIDIDSVCFLSSATPLPYPDTDNDNIPDTLDLDSDNDGIPDVTEADGSDPDGDGIIGTGDITDLDSDGLDDSVDPLDGYNPGNPAGTGGWTNGSPLGDPDQDNDNVPNRLDLDADNDGIPDVTEAGVPGNNLDPDGDGIIGTGDITDIDGDGLDDSVDPLDGLDPGNPAGTPGWANGVPLSPPNTDSTGEPNYLDIDADDDGIPDNVEAQTTAGYFPPSGNDIDSDGLDDAYDPLDGYNPGNPIGTVGWSNGTPIPPVNTESTGNPDYLDTDSDGDGTLDADENGNDEGNYGGGTPNGDDDGDGLLNQYDDSDDTGVEPDVNDNISDATIVTDLGDADNDAGAADGSGTTPLTADVDFRDAPPTTDTDEDGIPDNIDLDDDNDGIPDVDEPAGDTDGDGIPDTRDLDSDNDGVPDVTEAGGNDPDGDGIIGTSDITDNDGDGLHDPVDNIDSGSGGGEVTNGTPLTVPDTDGDGVSDPQDLDSDNDGVPDVTEAGGSDPDGDGIIGTGDITDIDGDGLDDSVDPLDGYEPSTPDGTPGWADGTPLPNPDTDNDNVPDVLDLDSDNDGIPDVTEAGGSDPDSDGIIGTGDITDIDGDGLDDSVDPLDGLNPGNPAGTGGWSDGTPLSNPDTDSDNVPDRLDLDSDNDGIPDVTEAGGTDPDGDGEIGTGNITDIDSDGLDDSVDPLDGLDPGNPAGTGGWSNGTPLPDDDQDSDTIPNRLDLDSDNDGIPDVIEGGGAGNNTDPDNDGIIGSGPIEDVNGNGLDDSVDPDQGGTPLPLPNTDSQGNPNWLDIDADDDGIPDNVEGQPTVGYRPPQNADTDGDGWDDEYDPSNGGTAMEPTNTDNTDNVPDYIDTDSDTDGIPDVQENGMTDTPGTTDTDGDGLLDDFEGGQLNDPTDVNDEINDPLNGILPDADNDAANGVPLSEDLDYRDIAAPTGKSILGDWVWFDADGDGFKDVGETGINGVVINLYGTSGLITSTTTITDINGDGSDTGVSQGAGYYVFAVTAGELYTVEVAASNFTAGGALEGFTYTGNNATPAQPYTGDESRIVVMPAIQGAHIHADFGYVVNGQVEVSKELVGADPYLPGQSLEFLITVTNTGSITLTTVPLEDRYSPAMLVVVSVDGQQPIDTTNDGTLNWANIAPAGGLAPNEVVTVSVEFVAGLDTSTLGAQAPCPTPGQTCNVAEVAGALGDPDGSGPLGPIAETPTVQAFDDVEILAPTAVYLSNHSTQLTANGIELFWTTLAETDMAGFNIMRQVGDGELEVINETMIVAEQAGKANGASYTFVDKEIHKGVEVMYILSVLRPDCVVESTVLGRVTSSEIFLPMVSR
ncbi:MAG: SdrD B-like domain-containing protein [Chloroflexota bacterium]